MHTIPMPGIVWLADTELHTAAEPWTVALLGLGPIVSAFVVVELLSLVVPGLSRLRHAGTRRAMIWLAIALSVVLSAVQGLQVTSWLAQSLQFSGEPIAEVNVAVVLCSATAATALLVALARWIDRDGLGNGFAVLTVFVALMEVLPYTLQDILRLKDTAPDLIALLLPVLVVLALTIGSTLLVDRWSAPGRLPLPSSGLLPMAGASSLAFVMMTQLDIASPRLLACLAMLLVVLPLASWLFNQPRRQAALLVRADPALEPEDAVALAKRRLLIATLATAGWLGLLMVVWSVQLQQLDVAPMIEITSVVTATMLALDLAEEWRFRAAAPDAPVVIWSEHRLYAVGIAAQRLEAEGIPVLARSRRLRALLQFFGPYVPVEFMVAPGDAARAAACLEAVLAPSEGQL